MKVGAHARAPGAGSTGRDRNEDQRPSKEGKSVAGETGTWHQETRAPEDLYLHVHVHVHVAEHMPMRGIWHVHICLYVCVDMYMVKQAL